MFCVLDGDRRFHDLSLIRDTAVRPCPMGDGLSAHLERGVWRDRPTATQGEIDLVGYDRRCLNGHEWTVRWGNKDSAEPAKEDE